MNPCLGFVHLCTSKILKIFTEVLQIRIYAHAKNYEKYSHTSALQKKKKS